MLKFLAQTKQSVIGYYKRLIFCGCISNTVMSSLLKILTEKLEIWLIVTLNQLITRVLIVTENKFFKNKVTRGKNPALCCKSILYSLFYLS